MADYRIRPINSDEYKLLDEFLYQAIFVPENTEKPDRSIIDRPQLQVYVKDFGKNKDDHCLLAENDEKVIGAVWVRIMNDYGHVSDDVPSLAISVLPEYRGKGIGRALLDKMLLLLKEKNYRAVSLSVQKENFAVRLYNQAGFRVIQENDEELIMIADLL